MTRGHEQVETTMTSVTPTNVFRHSPAEDNLLVILQIQGHVLDALGIEPEDMPERCDPIPYAVEQLRRGTTDETELARLNAAIEVDSAIVAYLDRSTSEAFGRILAALAAFAIFTKPTTSVTVVH